MRIGRAGLAVGLTLAVACGPPEPPSPLAYRLSGSGDHWDEAPGDPVFADLEPRYEEFFARVLDPGETAEPNLKNLRDDLERDPVDRRNYDALNAIAIGYFELNYRAVSAPGSDHWFADETRAAKLVAVPWKAYGVTKDASLRDSILDFFEDVALGEKLGSAETAGRLTPVVESLVRKESDAGRLARIGGLVETLGRARRAAVEAAERSQQETPDAVSDAEPAAPAPP